MSGKKLNMIIRKYSKTPFVYTGTKLKLDLRTQNHRNIVYELESYNLAMITALEVTISYQKGKILFSFLFFECYHAFMS
jgi:hypothetical protein